VFLKEKLEDGGKNSGVADLIAKTISEDFRVLVNSDVLEVYGGNGEFAEFSLISWSANRSGLGTNKLGFLSDY